MIEAKGLIRGQCLHEVWSVWSSVSKCFTCSLILDSSAGRAKREKKLSASLNTVFPYKNPQSRNYSTLDLKDLKLFPNLNCKILS